MRTPSPARSTSRYVLLSLELLEGRENPAALQWIGPEDGLWSDPDNWAVDFDPDVRRAPESTDELYFNSTGSGAATSSFNDIPDLEVIEIHGETPATITILEDLNVTSRVTKYGTMVIDDGAKLTTPNFQLFGNLILGSESIDAGLLQINTGSLILSEDGEVDLTIGWLAMLAGTTWTIPSGTEVDLSGDVTSSGTITLGEASSLDIAGDCSFGGATSELNLFGGTT